MKIVQTIDKEIKGFTGPTQIIAIVKHRTGQQLVNVSHEFLSRHHYNNAKSGLTSYSQPSRRLKSVAAVKRTF